MIDAMAKPLRIVLVLEPGGGGSARHVIDLASGLVSAGHSVEIVYSPCRAEDWYLQELNALPGVTLHSLAMRRELGLHDFAAALELRKLLQARGPFDVIHGHSSKAGALIRLAGVGIPGRKIYTPHALITLAPDLGGAKRALYTIAERTLDLFSDGVICVSDEERYHARDLGLGEHKLFTVENGLAELPKADRDGARAQLELGPNDVCLGFVGRISGQKSVHRLISAFNEVYSRCPNLVLAIVGDGPDLEETKKLARQLNVDSRIRFTGSADGVYLMSGFDAFVLPSRYEAFPYVFLEALARGLPIISMAVGGASSVIDEGVNGYVVPQSEPAGLAARMAEICADAELRRRMSAASLEKAREKTVRAMVERTLGVYRNLIAA